MKLFVANIPFDTTDEQLRALFDQYGDVSSAKAIFDRETGRPKGFGFVEMANVEDAERAISELAGTKLGNPPREIRIEEAKERPSYGGSRGGAPSTRPDFDRRGGGDSRGNRRDDRNDRGGRGGRR
jgi:nucleolin